MENTQHGICRLTLIPVRKEPTDRAEMVTQMLFGDHYTILEWTKDRRWLRIRIQWDGYEGWIDHTQFYPISSEYFDAVSNADYKICTDLATGILFKKHYIQVLIGSVLPISTNELFKVEEQLAYNGEAKSLSQKRDYEFLKQTAEKYIHAPYLWGGKSPFGIDCSGFTQMAYRVTGYTLQRDASQQVQQGSHVESLAQAVPGDLLFFKGRETGGNHVGILLEDHTVIHASGRVRKDQVDETGIFNAERNKHTHQLTAIRRVMKQT